MRRLRLHWRGLRTEILWWRSAHRSPQFPLPTNYSRLGRLPPCGFGYTSRHLRLDQNVFQAWRPVSIRLLGAYCQLLPFGPVCCGSWSYHIWGYLGVLFVGEWFLLVGATPLEWVRGWNHWQLVEDWWSARMRAIMALRKYNRDEPLIVALGSDLVYTSFLSQVIPQIHCRGIRRISLEPWGWRLFSSVCLRDMPVWTWTSRFFVETRTSRGIEMQTSSVGWVCLRTRTSHLVLETWESHSGTGRMRVSRFEAGRTRVSHLGGSEIHLEGVNRCFANQI